MRTPTASAVKQGKCRCILGAQTWRLLILSSASIAVALRTLHNCPGLAWQVLRIRTSCPTTGGSRLISPCLIFRQTTQPHFNCGARQRRGSTSDTRASPNLSLCDGQATEITHAPAHPSITNLTMGSVSLWGETRKLHYIRVRGQQRRPNMQIVPWWWWWSGTARVAPRPHDIDEYLLIVHYAS